MKDFVKYYNSERLHSAIGYIAPLDKLQGRDKQIISERKRKLANARKKRQEEWMRKQNLTATEDQTIMPTAGETEADYAGK